MKILRLITLLSVLIGCRAMAQDDTWSAQSSETQHNISSPIFSKHSGSNSKSLVQTMSKAGHSAQTKSSALHTQGAMSLQSRPVINNDENDFWIYDAWITLRNDLDYDGYVYRFSLEFDADTFYNEADVYARLYLARGEVFKEYHTTSVFTIFGENSEDSLLVDSELLQGFPTGDYELLIELYDAYTDELVAILDGNDDPDLYLISLESKDYEYVESLVVVEGGSMAYLILLLLPVFVFRRRRLQPEITAR
ncbi:MAG: choice-of-anchor H family protein [Paraglaciecola sp.]|nr:choice-of-anchor H family protein [Paraglaciecola sp.]MDP5133199.1 choice-of-anchor H family protein [Paraglaciecola sp.]